MSLSLYDLSVPVFTHSLTALAEVLKKAEAHADAKKIEHSVFLTARLAPDMFALTRQVQLATDFAKGGSARAAGRLPSSRQFRKINSLVQKTGISLFRCGPSQRPSMRLPICGMVHWRISFSIQPRPMTSCVITA